MTLSYGDSVIFFLDAIKALLELLIDQTVRLVTPHHAHTSS
jgi:putative NIF3 family GTP cyclohydrolase 1 type 2